MQPISCLSCYPESVSSSVGDLEASGRAKERQDQRVVSNNSSFDLADLNDDTPSTSLSTSPELRTNEAAWRGAQIVTPNAKSLEASLKRYPALGDGETCESCALSLPADTAKRLPAGAPGSPKADGMGRNGSPVLRSRESLQIFDDSQESDSDTEDDEANIQIQRSTPGSFASDTSSLYHKHTLTYISTSTPLNPSTYSIVRRATIHALSREQIPRGQTAGKLSFGDSVNGYTTAYKFRVSDPYARGGYRRYALLALCNNERRHYQATAFIFTRFQYVAASIVARTEEKTQQDKGPGERGDENSKSNLMPVSSFLTGRVTDPDGFPRHGGARQKARGLTEMVGDEKLFAELHLDFIGLLRDLRWRFDG